jgi:uncharacterized membrane protein
MTLLSVAIAGYFVGQYATGSLQALGANKTGLASNYAHRALPVQAAFYTHIVMAGIALAVGPFQFAKAIRNRHPRVHRWIGRTYVFSIAFGSVAAFVMSFFSEAGFVGFFGFGSLAVLWAWTTYRGYRAARDRDFASHQAWMIRSFALTFAAPTLRLWLGTLIGVFVLGGGTGDPFKAVYPAVPFLCWLPNIVVAELMINRRRLPGLRLSESPARKRAAHVAAALTPTGATATTPATATS